MGLLLRLNTCCKGITMTDKLKPISIRLPPELISDLKLLAKEKGFPGYQKLVKDILQTYVKEHDK